MAGRTKITPQPIVRKAQRAKVTSVRSKKNATQSGILDYFRFGESYTSLVLGIVVVIIASILLVSFLRGRGLQVNDTDKGTSSTDTTISQESTGGKTYTVKAGDDLWKIAEREYNDGFEWAAIAKANNLQNPGVIEVGAQLKLPAKNTAQAQQSLPVQNDTQVSQETVVQAPTVGEKITQDSYTVKSGDILWDVALRAYGDGYQWVKIAQANNLVNPNVIHSGNKLVIPRS